MASVISYVKKHFYHTFRGKRYRIVTQSKSRVYDGFCHEPSHKNRTVLVKMNFRRDKVFRLALHEALHAVCYDLSEEVVDQGAKDIYKFLKKLKLI